MAILKMGSTFGGGLSSRMGDFEDWVLQTLPETSRELFDVWSEGMLFPDPKSLKGLIITGSHSMVTHPSNWDKKAMHWVRWALDAGIPILGICYGHQMLAQILGGVVGFLPDGPEIGYERLKFLGDYEADPLFGLYPSHFDSFAFHYQTITRLPYSAKVLARSVREASHAVKYGENVWGVQYHPEFTRAIAQQYLIHESLEIERLGFDLRTLIQRAELERPPDPLIPRFVELC